jgi:hypothetical protein
MTFLMVALPYNYKKAPSLMGRGRGYVVLFVYSDNGTAK